MENAYLWILVIIGGIVFYQHYKGKLTWVGGRSTSKTVGAIGSLAVIGLVVGAYVTSLPVLGGVLEPIKFDSLSAGSSGDVPNTAAGSKTIESLTVTTKEKGSDSYTAVAGNLLFYQDGTDVSSATAAPIDTVAVAAGSGTSTAKKLKTNTKYHVVFNNGTAASWYDKDLGTVVFDGNDLSLNGALTFDAGEIQIVGTLDDILDETATTGIINGQSSFTAAQEINQTGGADGTLFYNETVGDGLWYVTLSPSCSGANGICKDAVLLFKRDLTNPPEGDEYSTITAQLMTGTDFGIDNVVTNNWKDELPISLGDIKAGQSASYKFVFSPVEANEDGSDDWTIRFDDLGDFLGKDIRNSVRATADTVTYGGSTT